MSRTDRPRACWRRVGIGAVLLVSLSMDRAGNPQFAKASDEVRTRVRLLVLTSGRIVDGTITPRAGGYDVDKPNGSMFIPFTQVKFQADDLPDAYRKLRDTMPDRTANSHLALARWCISHNQLNSARRELRDALHLEPDREQARRMLKRLDELGRPATSAAKTSEPKTLIRFADETVSLAGLSRETAVLFTTRIQPILMNNCATASCHGSASHNPFQLTRIRGRSHHVFSERNLANLLKYVDTEHPSHDRLHDALHGPHGRSGRSIFQGRSGARQLAALRNWLRMAATEQSADKASDTKIAAQTNAKSADAVTADGGAMDETADDADDILQTVLREERDDAFDPDQFNRLSNPRPARNAYRTNNRIPR